MGLMGFLMAYSGGLWGILGGLTKSTDHPRSTQHFMSKIPEHRVCRFCIVGIVTMA